MNVGSLFSGIGGLDLGLARAGHEHAFFCESDPWRRSILAHHWPGVPIYEDVAIVSGEAGEPVGVLCGGFPCQDVSVAGRRAGLAGERSGLFHEFARVIDAIRPRWILVENVPGLLSSNGGRDFGVVLGTLADLGYGLAWRILDSRYFGVPQRRRRVFILGAYAPDDPRGAAERCGEILAVGSRCERHPTSRGEAREDIAGALGASAGAGRGHDGNPFDRGGRSSLSGLGSGGADDNDAQAERLVAYNWQSGGDVRLSPRTDYIDALGANQVPAVGIRRLTPTECERLQALPDGFTNPDGTAPDSRRYAALGDAVTASVSEWIGRRISAGVAR